MKQIHDISNIPNSVSDLRFHRGCDSERLVYTAEVVIHEVQREGVLVILDFLRERIGQSSEAAHVHPHGKILPFGVAGRDMPPIGIPRNGGRKRTDALRRAVARLLCLRFIAVQLHKHGVINFGSEGQINGVQIGFVPIGSQLHAGCEPRGQVVHEFLSVISRTAPHMPAGNEFGVGADGCPGPNVSKSKFAAQFFWHVLFFGVAERPNFIALDSLARKVVQRLVLIFRARLADFREESHNGVLRHARHSHRGANRIALNKGRNDCGLAFHWEDVHAPQYA